MLNPELKAQWINALRSGKFKQGQEMLYSKRDNAYCCLGVLSCVASGKREMDGAYYSNGGYILADRELGNLASNLLQDMNDGRRGHHKHTFAEIADYIERNL